MVKPVSGNGRRGPRIAVSLKARAFAGGRKPGESGQAAQGVGAGLARGVLPV